MITGYVTIDSIIESVIRDTEDHTNIDIYDASEWAAKAMSDIGLLDSYEFGVTTIDIEAYKGELPFGMINILAARDNVTKTPLIKSTNQFFLNPTNVVQTSSSSEELDVPALSTNTKVNVNYTYYINSGYMYTNFDEGQVEIAFTTYPIDERGLPMIPNDESYKEAIKSYIIYRMDYILWRKGAIKDNIKRDSEQEWAFNAKKAFNRNILHPSDMENIFRGMVKIASDQNAFDYAFEFLNAKNVTNY